MVWLICGTVPKADFPLVLREWRLDGDFLRSGDLAVPVNRGTPALLAATLAACTRLETKPPLALLVGDEGSGTGSKRLYNFLADNLAALAPEGITFHYLFPDVDGHNQVLMAVEELPRRPLMVADAGFMYVAKMSGYADAYDLFTPDAGELAFLADEKAPHPFYTRGFLLADEDSVEQLQTRAHAHGNCPRNLLVKGKRDHIFSEGTLAGVVDHPCVEAMEPIGGTGDLVTGLVTAFLIAGQGIVPACLAACRTNRILGRNAAPTPATQVAQLLPYLPDALTECTKMMHGHGWDEGC